VRSPRVTCWRVAGACRERKGVGLCLAGVTGEHDGRVAQRVLGRRLAGARVRWECNVPGAQNLGAVPWAAEQLPY
jgi:hypothetical protein